MTRHEADHYAATRRVARIALEMNRAIKEGRAIGPELVERLDKAVVAYERTAEAI